MVRDSMSSYIVLARKWRSARFKDIVGQGPIVRTLTNAIRQERLHQAYLFTGSRGIGKTSIARIFAKAVRCPHRKFEDEQVLSCEECTQCREISASSSVDVIEIDGASNNGVDAIREIRESAKYLPSSGDHKIYIIDEVHMLTTAAFNALLKTLEEPPAHVIFIFATTEPHKIPATIISRVQRFDFRRITTGQMIKRLEFIAGHEEIKIDEPALQLIADAAEGSMRDALSLLDQVIAYSGQEVNEKSVRASIGLVERESLFKILRSILDRKPLDAVRVTSDAYDLGYDLKIIIRHLIEQLHQVILAKVGAPAEKDIADLSEKRPLEELELIFQALSQGAEWISRSPQPKIVLDILMIKCAMAETLVPLGDGPVSSKGSAGASSGTKRGPENTKRSSGAAVTSGNGAQASATRVAGPGLVSEAPASDDLSGPATRIRARLAGAGNGDRAVGGGETPRVQAVPVIPQLPSQQKKTEAAPVVSLVPKKLVQDFKDWEGLVHKVQRERPLIGSLLENAHGFGFEPGQVAELNFYFHPQDELKREQLQKQNHLKVLEQCIEKELGQPLRVQLHLQESDKESLAKRRSRSQEEKIAQAKNEAVNHPVIKEARALFGAKIGPIELLQ